jgi:hypothetical protein
MAVNWEESYESDLDLQLTSKRTKSYVLPSYSATLRRCQLRDVHINGIVEAKVWRCVLIEESKDREHLCYRGNAILAITINMHNARSLLVMMMCAMVLCPERFLS